MPKGTSGNNAQFTYDFGIAIAQGTLRKIERLTGTTLTLAGAFYALKSSAAEYVDTLKKNTILFGGQLSTIKAMEQAQDRLLKGISHFSMTDQLDGMKKLAASGIDARKNLEWIDKAAHATGKSFSEFSGAIASAIQGNMSSLVDMGLMTQRATRMFDKYQANTIMRQQAILNFVKQHKGLQSAIANDFETIKDQMRRLGAAWKTFLHSIIGNPSDPGSLYGTIVGTFKNIADAISRNKVAIQNAGLAIGMSLSWIVRNVGHVVMWMGRQVKKAMDMVGLSSENFAEKLRSFFVWLEFWKVRIVNFFREYKDQIKTALKWTLILIGTMKLLKLAFGTKMGKAFLVNLADDLRSGVGLFKAFFGNLWFMFTGRISMMGGVVGRFFGNIAKWTVLITKGFINSIKAIGAAFFGSNPVGWILLVVAALVTLYKKCEGVRKIFNTIGMVVMEWAKMVWNFWQLIWVGIVRTARDAWAKLKNAFKTVREKLSALATPIKKFFDWIDRVATKIYNKVKNFLPWLKGKNNQFADFVDETAATGGVKVHTVRSKDVTEEQLSKDYLSFGAFGKNPLVTPQATPSKDDMTSQASFSYGDININVQGGQFDETKLAQKIKQVIQDMQRDNLIRAGA